MLSTGEMARICEAPGLYLEQKKCYMMSRSYFIKGGRKSAELKRNDSEAMTSYKMSDSLSYY